MAKSGKRQELTKLILFWCVPRSPSLSLYLCVYIYVYIHMYIYICVHIFILFIYVYWLYYNDIHGADITWKRNNETSGSETRGLSRLWSRGERRCDASRRKLQNDKQNRPKPHVFLPIRSSTVGFMRPVGIFAYSPDLGAYSDSSGLENASS